MLKLSDGVTLDDFTEAYIEAALWSTTNSASYDAGGSLKEGCSEYLDAEFDQFDFATEALARIIEDCRKFQAENEIPEYNHPQYDDEEMAGHDFWLTRNRHGVGFWDRGLGEVGEKLTAAAHAYGEVEIYVGDDGKLYLM